ncbi:Os09g0362200 [Oryza sativa Japonica Group]|uniref:Os09g0362200 protein n=1 Tax=Oryza sativa subsp. japonica TaxID=39947 RepID=A0A0P0XL73_ORYSJ|nr:Os09g0362200 [Oryza sativa Japonica Group]
MKRPAEAARREAGGARRRSSWPAAEGCGSARTSSWREPAARTWQMREPAACGSGAEGAVGGIAVIVVVEEGGRRRRGGMRRLADVIVEGAGGADVGEEGAGGARI